MSEENISAIDNNLKKISTIHDELNLYKKNPKNKTINKGNIAQFVNPNLPTRDIEIKFLNNRTKDYEESIKQILLSLYDELHYIDKLEDIYIISDEIKSNYEKDKDTRINAILIKEYNKLISELKIFDNDSILNIYNTISDNVEKFKIIKKFTEMELIFFNSLVKKILIDLNILNIVKNIMENNYPESKDKKTSLKRFVKKIEDIINANILGSTTIKLENLIFNLNKSINTNIHQEILSSEYEMQNLLKQSNIKINKKKSQLAYNNIIKKFKSKEDGYELSFIKLEELSDLFH